MTIVAAVHYDEAGAASATIDLETASAPAGPGFDWIGLCDPDPEEMEAIRRVYQLHSLSIEDALDERQMPKLENYGEQLFLIARTVELVDGRLKYGETAFFLGRHFVITVRHGSPRSHSTLRAQLEAAPELLAHGPDYVLHAILDDIVDSYFPIVNAIEDDVLAMEDRLLEGFLKHEDIAKLFAVRHDVIRFQRVLALMQELAQRLVNQEFPCIDANTMPYFRDVLDHVNRAEYRVGGLREVLSSAIENSSLVEQQRQGEIARQLAAWAAILAVPTAIAGIYGMNFDHMPELRWTYGYPMVIGIMLTICGTLYVRFKRSGWL